MTTPEHCCVDFPMTEPIPLRAKALSMVPSEPATPVVPEIPIRGADINEVLRCVCQSFMVSVADLTSKRRHKNISEARLVTYWLLRTLTKMSYPEIGIALRKEHTSVMSGIKACVRRRALEPAFLAFTDELQAAVAARLKGDV